VANKCTPLANSCNSRLSLFDGMDYPNPALVAGFAGLPAAARGNGNSILEWIGLGQLVKHRHFTNNPAVSVSACLRQLGRTYPKSLRCQLGR